MGCDYRCKGKPQKTKQKWKMFETSVQNRRREKYTRCFTIQRQNSFLLVYFLCFIHNQTIYLYIFIPMTDYNSCIITIFKTRIGKTKVLEGSTLLNSLLISAPKILT